MLHRVTDGVADADGTVPQRNAAIFFVAPDVGARLEPVIRDGEVPHYASALTHGEFKVSSCDEITRGRGVKCACIADDLMYACVMYKMVIPRFDTKAFR